MALVIADTSPLQYLFQLDLLDLLRDVMAMRPQLRDELLTLSADERQQLADELYESLVDAPPDAEWEHNWAEESNCASRV